MDVYLAITLNSSFSERIKLVPNSTVLKLEVSPISQRAGLSDLISHGGEATVTLCYGKCSIARPETVKKFSVGFI